MILSLDINAFYCAVEEKLDNSLRETAFAVTQKNIVATLSYAARDLGLKKLMLVSELLKRYPGMRTINGENLTKYRAEGKLVWQYVQQVLPSCAIQRLGLEEMFIDISDIVAYNYQRLCNSGQRVGDAGQVDDDQSLGVELVLDPATQSSFHCADFHFGWHPNATVRGCAQSPQEYAQYYIASHLAGHLMERLALDLTYSVSVGIASNKLLSKLIGATKKPNGLSVLFPTAATQFLDALPISAVTGIGSQTVHELAKVLGPDPLYVSRVKCKSSESQLVGLFGSQRGSQIWNLIHGIDNTPILPAPIIPSQVGVEDTFLARSLVTLAKVHGQLVRLSVLLLKKLAREVLDLETGRFIQYPTTLRLTVRLFTPLSAARFTPPMSKSEPLPSYLYRLCDTKSNPELLLYLARRMASDNLESMFKQLASKHFDVKLLNVAVTRFSPDPNPDQSRHTGKKVHEYFATRGL